MVDRVKYFLLGLLFLVVAGVIAYDRWNTPVGADENRTNGARADVHAAPAPELDPPPLNVPHDPLPNEDPDEKKAAKPEPKPVQPKPLPPKPKPAPPAKARVHVVKSGENLEGIAVRYYKTRAGVVWIVEANALKDKNKIFLNQKLIIPARKDLDKPAAITRPRKPAVLPSEYKVKSGEDLYDICRRFYGGTGLAARVAGVMRRNSLWTAKVKSGTVLSLPPK